MQIEVFTEVLHADAGAFDMPAGVAYAPRAVPFEFLVFKLGLREPENEISLIALVLVCFNAVTDADCKILLGEVVEYIVFIKL